uniref:Uncharacterized protein n=1 Tax=Leersia perrieri TaxID=77586 RepID=A0A0D9VGP3_9ORYZ
MAPRLAATVVVVFFLVVAAHARLGEGGGTLRGSVGCLDCAPGHDLSGVVVAVRCGGGAAPAGLRAAQTDERGGFEVAVPANVDDGVRRGHPRCAARVLGGAEQLCALGSRLAVFTRCGGAVATTTTTTMAAEAAAGAGEQKSPATPRSPRTPTPRQTPAGTTSPPRGATPRYDGPGLPLIYFFPFLPIIGIP